MANTYALTDLNFQTTSGIAKTYLYTDAQALTEGGHYYVDVECPNYVHLTIEYPNSVARDKWLQVFNAADSSLGHGTTSWSGQTRVPPQQSQENQLQIKERAGFSVSPQSTGDGTSSPELVCAIKHALPSDPTLTLGEATQNGGATLQEPPSEVPGPLSAFSGADLDPAINPLSGPRSHNPTFSETLCLEEMDALSPEV